MLYSESLSKDKTPLDPYQKKIANGTETNQKLQIISDDESERILSISSIRASPVLGKSLTINDLIEVGIRPKYQLSLDNRRVFLTGCIFPIEGSHIATTVFVQRHKNGEGPEEYAVRTYYRSNSQGGEWRYLPGVLTREERSVWFSKGHHENSVTAPFELFKALCELRNREGVKYSFPKETSNQLIQGTTHGIRGHAFLYDPTVTYVQQVQPEGVGLQDSQCYIGLKPPHEVTISDPQDFPDFDTCLDTVECEAPLFSDGVPDQVIMRGPDLKQPLVVDLERDTNGDAVTVTFPSGIVCSFEKNSKYPSEFTLQSIRNQRGEILFQASSDFRSLDDGSYAFFHDLPDGKILFDSKNRFVGILGNDGSCYDCVHGKMIVRHFSSCRSEAETGESLRFTFHTDTRGRSMIGAIQRPGELTSLGIYRDWAASRSLLVPIYEYSSQAGMYGDFTDVRSHYVCMWEGYLSKVHVINAYTRRFVDNTVAAIEAPEPVVKGQKPDNAVVPYYDQGPHEVSVPKVPKRRNKIEKNAALSIDGANYHLTLSCEESPSVSIRSPRMNINYQYGILRMLPCIPLEGKLLNEDGTLAAVDKGVARLTFASRQTEEKHTFEVHLEALPDKKVTVNGVPLKSNRKILLLRATRE
jgi:hypothetical protein